MDVYHLNNCNASFGINQGSNTPTLIYLIKYFFANYGAPHQITSPDWLRLFSESATFYIPKTSYVFFCLPVLAVSIDMIKKNIILNKWLTFESVVYFSAIALAMLVFYLEKILNGEVYGVFLILTLPLSLFSRWFFKLKKLQKSILILISAILVLGTSIYVDKNFHIGQKVKNLSADLRVVLSPNKYSQWKLSIGPTPKNEVGIPVNVKYYARLSWAYNALVLIAKNPLGYGLIEQSLVILQRLNGQIPSSLKVIVVGLI